MRQNPDVRTRSSASGLTLIEVVVTITVIALIAAVVVPAFADFATAPDAGALEPLRGLLVSARQEASLTGQPVEVVVVPTSGRYHVRELHSPEVPIRSGTVRISGARVSGPADRFRVVFNPIGLGVGDTIVAEDVRLLVDVRSGKVTLDR